MPQIPSRVCSVPSLARCQFSVANFLTGNNLFSLSFKCTLDGGDRRDFYVIDVRMCVCSLVCFFQTMSQSNFLLSLQNFAKDTINDEMVELLAPYLEMEDYNMETAKRVSNDCILIVHRINNSDIYQVFLAVHQFM